jgi:acetyltransferase-like isoleucine patch superfamily enzyme
VSCWWLQGYNVTIGKGVYMNFNCCLLDCAPISIGDNVLFGPNVQASTPRRCLHHNTSKLYSILSCACKHLHM